MTSDSENKSATEATAPTAPNLKDTTNKTHENSVLSITKPGGCGGIRGDVVATGPFGDRRALASDPLSLRSRLTWTSGDFARIAAGFADGASAFVDRLSLTRGERTHTIKPSLRNNCAPPVLRYLEARIDEVAGTRAWIACEPDPFCLEP